MAEPELMRRGGPSTVLRTTRLLSAVIVPFLVAAWWILFLQPDRTGALFAWPVQPSMTAMLLGAVYLGGAYFFVRATVARRWEEIALGFLPVAGFATLMGIATLLHWDRFTHGHVSFVTWATLYFTTPVLVVAAWWANDRHARAASSASASGAPLRLSRRAQISAGVLGAAAVLVGLLLFVWPQLLIEVWPWALTPLTARVVGAVFVLGGAGLGIARDPLWESARLLVQVLWVMLGQIAVATVRAWSEFQRAPATWVFVGWMVVVLAGSIVLYLTMEREARARRGDAGRPPVRA